MPMRIPLVTKVSVLLALWNVGYLKGAVAFPASNSFFQGHSIGYATRLHATDSNPYFHNDDEQVSTITVSYEGQSCEIKVRQGESILSALERQGRLLQSRLTALPNLPSDCRRGNCLTCAASLCDAERSSVIRVDDGLSPTMSKLVSDKGYILTCSSYVLQAGDHNVTLELGEHDAVWKAVYLSPGRFTTSDAELVARSAMARTIRKAAERNIDEYIEETEKVLKRSDT